MTRATMPTLAAIAATAALLVAPSRADAAPPPSLEVFAVERQPRDIALGPDGNMWFTTSYLENDGGPQGEDVVDAVGRISADGATTVFPVQTGAFLWGMRSLTTGADGNLWVAADFAYVYRVASDGTVTGTFDRGNFNQQIAAGPNGTIWLTIDPSVVVALDTAGQRLFNVRVTGPDGMALGPDGNMWVGGDFGVTRITPDGVETTFRQGFGPGPVTSLTAGPDGNVWFAQLDSLPAPGVGDPKRIGRITPNGEVVRFTTDESPGDLVGGPDGAVWYTERVARRVVRISPDGATIGYDLPAAPIAIAASPDGSLWLTLEGGQIARFAPGPPAIVPEAPLAALLPICAAATLAALSWKRRRAPAHV